MTLPVDAHRYSATTLAQEIRAGRISPVELVDDVLDRIASTDPGLNAFLTVSADQARGEARAAEARLAAETAPPELLGVPISVKDLEPTAGIRTTYGSPLCADYIPDYDSVAVERLRAAGAIVLGKTNTPEFGLLGETRNLLSDDCRNPWDRTRTSGGSSGGAAAAVAAGLGPIGLGNDGAGSVVAPAAFCGVLGMKATRGRVPFPAGESASGLYVDVGVLARSVNDLELAFRVMSGPHSTDPQSIRQPPSWSDKDTGLGVAGLRIATSEGLGHFPASPSVLDALHRAGRRLEELGADVRDETPGIENPWDVYDPIFLAETWGALREDMQAHPNSFLPETLAELEPAKDISGPDVIASMRRWWRLRRDLETFFDRFDALLVPTTATTAFPIRQEPTTIGGVAVRPHWTTYMPCPVVANITGLPEVSVPAGYDAEGMPIGVLVLGARGREDHLFRIARALIGDGELPIAEKPSA